MRQTKKGEEKYLTGPLGGWTKNKSKAWYMDFADAQYYSGIHEAEITM